MPHSTTFVAISVSAGFHELVLATALASDGLETETARDADAAERFLDAHAGRAALVIDVPRLQDEAWRELAERCSDQPLVVVGLADPGPVVRALGEKRPFELVREPFDVGEIRRALGSRRACRVPSRRTEARRAN